MNAKPPNLSVVVLCYRSADTIASFVNLLVASLNQHEPDWEVVLVGNFIEGSGDRTPDVVKNLAKTNPRIRSVTLAKEGMMGWDMISGLKTATGKVISVIDGDGQMPHEDVIRTYNKLKDEGLDLVKTYRTERDDGSYRRFISSIYNIIFKILFPGLKNRDINSKPKIFTREIYEQMDLHSDGWFIDAEIMIQARRLKLKIGEIPTGFRNMYSRPSFVKPQAIFEFMGNLVWYRIKEFWYWFK
jgi:glycosyltransferase involved in cell wall biosynthesis